jgi:hypothetical protein
MADHDGEIEQTEVRQDGEMTFEQVWPSRRSRCRRRGVCPHRETMTDPGR